MRSITDYATEVELKGVQIFDEDCPEENNLNSSRIFLKCLNHFNY